MPNPSLFQSPLDLLETDTWHRFAASRGFLSGDIGDRLYRIGLAKRVGGELQPVRAAVLLFADEPGGLLAAQQTRADVRIFHYRGKQIEPGAVPNLLKPPKTISGPLPRQIAHTSTYVLDALAAGLTLAASGFKTIHRYPERVIKEAITNAVVHRDYRMNRDIQIRIFDNRAEMGLQCLAGSIERETPADETTAWPAFDARNGSETNEPCRSLALSPQPLSHEGG